MTIIIENIKDQLTERVPYECDEDDMYVDMREMNYNVIDTDHPLKYKDEEYRTLKIEFIKYNSNQDFTKPYTWSWDICYDTDIDTYYFAHMALYSDKYHGSRYREFGDCFCDAYDSMMQNLDEIKRMISSINDETKEIR